MWRSIESARFSFAALLLIALALWGCEQLPPTPQDIEARQFPPAPGRSVIYIVRDIPDWNPEPATILLDEASTITTYPGTYYRWEVDPGRHRITGFAGDSGVIAFQTLPDRFYYIQQRVLPYRPFVTSHFEPVSEQAGRSVVMRSKLVE